MNVNTAEETKWIKLRYTPLFRAYIFIFLLLLLFIPYAISHPEKMGPEIYLLPSSIAIVHLVERFLFYQIIGEISEIGVRLNSKVLPWKELIFWKITPAPFAFSENSLFLETRNLTLKIEGFNPFIVWYFLLRFTSRKTKI